jgi:hypothetical protein
MKTTFKQLTLIIVAASAVCTTSFAIDDSVIFENIDNQNAFHKEMQNAPVESLKITGAADKRIVVEERSTSYASPSNQDIFTFDKEKVTAKTTIKLNKKKKETLAKELKELVD